MGGYSNMAPPLPIPNREVKHISADGTGFYIGRVSRRPFFLYYSKLSEYRSLLFISARSTLSLL